MPNRNDQPKRGRHLVVEHKRGDDTARANVAGPARQTVQHEPATPSRRAGGRASPTADHRGVRSEFDEFDDFVREVCALCAMLGRHPVCAALHYVDFGHDQQSVSRQLVHHQEHLSVFAGVLFVQAHRPVLLGVLWCGQSCTAASKRRACNHIIR
jgi:hypothetical protein